VSHLRALLFALSSIILGELFGLVNDLNNFKGLDDSLFGLWLFWLLLLIFGCWDLFRGLLLWLSRLRNLLFFFLRWLHLRLLEGLLS